MLARTNDNQPPVKSAIAVVAGSHRNWEDLLTRLMPMRLRFRIVADPTSPGLAGSRDPIAGQRFNSYDEAYDVLEQYYADLCCSDERIDYQIVEEHTDSAGTAS
mgnify:CR=1 FL=1